jgi:hypothetical protein
VLTKWREHRSLQSARRDADEQLLDSRLISPRLAWRVAELTSLAHRVDLGRALTEVVHAADERLLPGARPLDRAAIRKNRSQLLDLASTLFDRDRAVAARGVVMIEHLLDDSRGPLYGHSEPRRLRVELLHVREALTA